MILLWEQGCLSQCLSNLDCFSPFRISCIRLINLAFHPVHPAHWRIQLENILMMKTFSRLVFQKKSAAHSLELISILHFSFKKPPSQRRQLSGFNLVYLAFHKTRISFTLINLLSSETT